MSKSRRLLATSTAARVLEVSTETVRRLKNQLEYEIDSNGRALFTEESVRKLAERRKRAANKKNESVAA